MLYIPYLNVRCAIVFDLVYEVYPRNKLVLPDGKCQSLFVAFEINFIIFSRSSEREKDMHKFVFRIFIGQCLNVGLRYIDEIVMSKCVPFNVSNINVTLNLNFKCTSVFDVWQWNSFDSKLN